MSVPIQGLVAPGFEAVRDAVLANFETRDELGAQVAIYKRGEPLVQLSAGWADRKKTVPVADDTLFSVYSCGKAMAALVIAHLVETRRISYDLRVADIWPAFARFGKQDLSVAQVMSHQAGLSGITDPEFDPQDWIDFDRVISVLEDQEPLFPPGSRSGYHPVTFGFLAGEIARRVDPEHRRLGLILREDIAAPTEADVYIGMDPADHARVAQTVKPRAPADLGEITDATRAAFLQPWSSPGRISAEAWREAEMAGSNCQASAFGIGALMGAFVDGMVGRRAVLSEPTRAEAIRSRIHGPDAVLPFTIDFAAGVMINGDNRFFGPRPNTLGHPGWGGSTVFADPQTGLHGAYVMNRQQPYLAGDPRAVSVITAAFESLPA